MVKELNGLNKRNNNKVKISQIPQLMKISPLK